MTFEMNNLKWIIKEATADEVKQEFGDNKNDDSYYYGITTLSKQRILINKEITIEKQKQTLYHELMHCYIYSYITDNLGSIDEETFCDISAKSHDIIHEIAFKYFKNR